MKRATYIALGALLLVAVGNYFYYSNLYRKQIEYISKLLDRQAQVIGQEVDEFNLYFTSDLAKIDFTDDIGSFFDDPEINRRAIERLKLYFIKYNEFITSLSIINNRTDIFNISLDETRDDFRKGVFTSDDYWLINTFQTHDQQVIYDHEVIIQEDSKYHYFQPILGQDGKIVANFKVSVDHNKYFSALFERFKSEQYQWQWLVNDTGKIIQDNFSGGEILYEQTNKIIADISDGSTGNIIHRAIINGDGRTVISSYCPVSLLAGMEYGIIFSAPTDFFQSYIIRNSTVIVVFTIVMIVVVIIVFRWQFKKQGSGMIQARDAEMMMNRLIEKMPVGVIIFNSRREILKANQIASGFYSYEEVLDMTGKIYPEPHVSDESNYFSKHLGGKFDADQFVIIRKEIGELVLFRSSIPVVYAGVDATMEILIDVTMLESARKQEAKANVAKSEFLARMSYEIRTPLNGIIGMADMLAKYELEKEASEMVVILRRSTELLLGIINDILDFSSIESGRIILDEIPFDLHQELGFCIDFAQNKLGNKKIKLNCDIGEDIPDSIIGDPFRLRQVLTNLMLFAVNNTDAGEINLFCRKKKFSEGVITLEFDLKDTGKGYDKVALKTIFGEFVQNEILSVRNQDNSGLGTVLARQLVEIMGGKLSASSPSGLSNDPAAPGTRILFTVSVYSNEREPKTYDRGAVKSFSDIKALVITGTQNRDEDMLSVFHKTGIRTVVTTYNKSTANQIKASNADDNERYNLIIITDDEDINGYEVAGNIMLNGLHTSFAMIMVSAVDLKGNYLKCINMGVDHYLVKPVDSDEVIAALAHLFPEASFADGYHDSRTMTTDLEVLVVEDNKMNSKVIGTMLRSLGYNPDFAENGLDACRMAENKAYDLIFMDLMMPEMDGYEASRVILSSNKSVVIAAFTADNMPQTRKKAEMAGINEFISKPVRVDHLKSVFRKYFGDRIA